MASGCEWIVAGLGNPGRQYEASRHNTGFRALDALAEALNVKVDRIKFRGLTAQAVSGGTKLLLLKPQTFMNLSGQSIREAAAFYRIPPERVLVLFDDISLQPGRLRIRADGSAGGHNGLKSIIAELGSQTFPRVKIGVGEKPRPDYDLADWVLSGFPANERAEMAEAERRAAEAALFLIENGVADAANRYNGK